MTRTAEVSEALDPILLHYEVLRFEPGEIERQVRTTGELRFRFNETDFYFNLEPHNMRGPNYRAVATGSRGIRRPLPSRPVHTFKGVLAGGEDTRGRFNLTDDAVEGVVYAAEGWVYVEPLRNYVPNAPAGELVVYREADIKPDEGFKCDVSLPRRLQRGVARVASQAEASFSTNPTNYVVDVATEADYEYVQKMGGAVEANRNIEGILNHVEGVFQHELLVQLRIGFQHAWEMEDDPYTGMYLGPLLTELYSYWTENFAAARDSDIIHLWTGKFIVDLDGKAGGRVCMQSAGYAATSVSEHQNNLRRDYAIPAHEIGHNLGASHPWEQIPPIDTCYGTVMSSGEVTFCQFSRDEIARHLAQYNSCLDIQSITLQPPTGLSAQAASSSRINLSWQDNSSNETGFRVQRRRLGSGNWVQIGTTAPDTQTYSSTRLFPDATYIYRVHAVSESESSAYSNEASATTLAATTTSNDWTIYTIAGRTDDDGDNGPAVQARLARTAGVAADKFGNLYIADYSNNRIRRVDASGTITTVAGTGKRGYGGDGGPAVAAQLDGPVGVLVDESGNLYVGDSGNHRIRRVDASGTITTVAGNGERGYSGDGGPAVAAQLHWPEDLAMDKSGNLYIADTSNQRIRRVDASGTITTIAGNGGRGYGGNDGRPAVQVSVTWPSALAVDSSGNLYIAASGDYRILRVNASGIITTVAGTGEEGDSGDGGPAVAARLGVAIGIALDGAGNLYIADTDNNRIRRVDASGTITTIAGTDAGGFGGDGGPAVRASLLSPIRLALDSSGNLYVADGGNGRIRRVDTSGTITTVAGIGASSYRGDGGPAVRAWLYDPLRIAFDRSGNLYIADSANRRVRRVDTSGTITTVAGTGENGYGGDGGPAVEAQLGRPTGVAVDGSGNLYISDSLNHRIRRVSASGTITTVVPEIIQPQGLAVDGSGNLYIAQVSRVLRLDASGTITTVAGTGEIGLSGGDGGPAVEATLGIPGDVALDASGNLYIADSYNHRIRRVDTSGIITTVAGIGSGIDEGGAGPATEAVLNNPRAVAVDRSGNLYITDTTSNKIKRVDTSGIISTIAGTGKESFSGDGGPAIEADLYHPQGIAVDLSGNVYVADQGNHRIRMLTNPSTASPPSPPADLTARAVSASEINLNWRDTSSNEIGFRVQRRLEDYTDWVPIGTVAANSATFSDVGLSPGTSYIYRVQAFNRTHSSTFSNEAPATTVAVLPPTLTRFTPATGAAGTRVTLTGTQFLGTSDVRFNGVSAVVYEVVSGTSIEAVVPPGATSGPISVVTPGGTAESAEPFTVTTGIQSRLFVPIVLRSQGRTPGSLFTSELTLTNRGSTTADIDYTYRAAYGGSSGTAVDSLEPGRQRVIPDAIAYLKSLGVPVGAGSAGGTLMVDFSNLSSPSDAAVTVRVTTPVELGRAGLAFVGLNNAGLNTTPALIAGLRQNKQDRSNVALQNAGDVGEGSITLRVTVFSGDSPAPEQGFILPDRTLAPGGFHQFDSILDMAGFENGYVKVERVRGTAPFHAYGVVNDNFNSDGSFVFPVTAAALAGRLQQTLPVIVETVEFASELTVTNFSDQAKTLHFSFVAEGLTTSDRTARFSLRLNAGRQRIIPDVIDSVLRRNGVEGLRSSRGGLAGALFATVESGDMSGIVIGARTSSSDGGGGQYGLFYPAVPDGAAFTTSAWVDGLQQDGENRSNLAMVNTAEIDSTDSVFDLDIYDGETGKLVRTVKTEPLPARRWHQINRILADHAPGTTQGYIRIRKTSGNNPFLAYGVVNDGGAPGKRSGDGAFVPARE